MNEEAWRLSIPGATFHNLLCRPFGARVRRHVDVENLPAGVIDQAEDVECPKEDRLDAEEIARPDGRCVSLQEYPRTREGTSIVVSTHVLGDCSGRSFEPEPRQFGLDP